MPRTVAPGLDTPSMLCTEGVKLMATGAACCSSSCEAPSCDAEHELMAPTKNTATSTTAITPSTGMNVANGHEDDAARSAAHDEPSPWFL